MNKEIERHPFSISYIHKKSGEKGIIISGDFRSGYYFEKHKEEIKRIAEESVFVLIDLDNVIFMDSDTINFIKTLEDEAQISFDTDSMVYKRYMEK